MENERRNRGWTQMNADLGWVDSVIHRRDAETPREENAKETKPNPERKRAGRAFRERG